MAASPPRLTYEQQQRNTVASDAVNTGLMLAAGVFCLPGGRHVIKAVETSKEQRTRVI